MRILAVDDEPDILFIIRAALEEGGEHTVLRAETAEEGVALAIAERPDGILMDVSMPVMDGHAALRRLRADPRTRHIPVIFLSARVGEDDIAEGIALGAAGYITKPFNPCLLPQHVRELIDAAHAANTPLGRSATMANA